MTRPRIPRRVLLRFALFLALLAAAFAAFRWTPLAGYLDRQVLTELFADLRQTWWSPVVLVVIYLVACPLGLPVSPLIFAGGAVFGAGWGALWNYLGTFLGAAVSYALALGLGRDFIRHLAHGRLQRVERALARQSFWSLVRVRFIPIPFPVVNFGAALAGVPPGRFLSSTAVGLLPTVSVYSYLAATLLRAAAGERGAALGEASLALALLFALSFLPRWIAGRRRRRRYRETLARRAARDAARRAEKV